MSILFGDDTSPEVEALLIAGYQRMTPQEKFQRVLDLNRTVRTPALARARAEPPDASAHEPRMRLGSLRVDAVRAAFGWDPDQGGCCGSSTGIRRWSAPHCAKSPHLRGA